MAVKTVGDGRSDGTEVGQSATDKVGFWGTTPVDQPAAIADATDAATAISQLNFVIAALEECGILASS